jgi:hypothetical protein
MNDCYVIVFVLAVLILLLLFLILCVSSYVELPDIQYPSIAWNNVACKVQRNVLPLWCIKK